MIPTPNAQLLKLFHRFTPICSTGSHAPRIRIKHQSEKKRNPLEFAFTHTVARSSRTPAGARDTITRRPRPPRSIGHRSSLRIADPDGYECMFTASQKHPRPARTLRAASWCSCQQVQEGLSAMSAPIRRLASAGPVCTSSFSFLWWLGKRAGLDQMMLFLDPNLNGSKRVEWSSVDCRKGLSAVAAYALNDFAPIVSPARPTAAWCEYVKQGGVRPGLHRHLPLHEPPIPPPDVQPAMDAYFTLPVAFPIAAEQPAAEAFVDRDDSGGSGDHSTCVIA
ncbi:uncharacterized protein BXZ73DRAFT_81130 [Epithele typhae]|uniref:uncharacterized protein n=1 Tax=Epithele typhae TaxID=378194 RepID=UPI002007DABD|nr:uncharacterized protein BXZ73DRAFT_81130 [Epithele typhae]KAH9916263.1 hypothetical protein BXZ73DRAFT_81130 [Epithele typhae]